MHESEFLSLSYFFRLLILLFFHFFCEQPCKSFMHFYVPVLSFQFSKFVQSFNFDKTTYKTQSYKLRYR